MQFNSKSTTAADAAADLAHQAASFPTRFVNLDAAYTRFGERVGRVGAQLSAGDPLADAAVAALRGLPRELSARLIDAGAREGVAALSHAPQALRDYFSAQEDVPAWADFGAMRRGGELMYRTNKLSGLALAAKCIVLGYASPAGNKPLIMAGGLIERAPRRLNETGRYVRGVILPEGLKRGGEGYVATCKVRLMHAQVRMMLRADKRWEAARWGVPINQHDMAATTILFSLAVIESLETLGVMMDATEVEEYMHLWRYAGHLMGVSHTLLPASRRDAEALSALISATQAPPDEDARKLTRALVGAAVREARTPAEIQQAERGTLLLRAGAYVLLGDDLAKSLGFEPTAWTRTMPAIRRLVMGSEQLQRAMPLGRQRAIAAGVRYWDDVQKRGISLYDTPFQLPGQLAP